VLLSVWIKIREWVKHSLYMLTLTVSCTDWTLILRVSMFRLTSDDKVYPSLGHNVCNVYFTFSVWIRVVGREREGKCVDTAKSFIAEYQSLHTFTKFSKFPTDDGRWSHRRTKWRNRYVFVRLTVGARSLLSIVRIIWFIRPYSNLF